jgi:hypothetical protein
MMQVSWLFLLALPIACVAWTVTHEEVFREAREYCVRRSEDDRRWYVRKFFYLFTCEYCFLIGGFALVWIANTYMSVFARLRLVIKAERVEIALKEEEARGQ